MDIANLIIRVTNEGLDRATRELRRLQENAQGAQAANKKFGESIADLNKLALVGFGALTAVVGGSIKTAIDFEKAMAGVAKTVDFATDNGLANMKKGIEDLTKTIPLAFEELAEIASVGGSLGVVEDDILGFTETIAKMGVAFDISAGDAADSMAKIAGVFKIPIAEIDTLGDSINAVSNSVAATAGDVIEVMKRVGGTSGALKISADNTAALSGAMVALGLTPEVAGTAFNTLGVTLANFNDLTKTQASGFKRLGLDTKEFAGLIQTDGVGAIKQVLEAAKELGGTDALSALNEAFGAQGIKILQMAEGLDVVDLALEQVAIDANGVSAAFGSMDAEFASVSSTTANKLQLVQNNMRLLAAGVGEAFLPAVNELILALVPVIEKMTAWAQANPELIVQIAKVVAAVTGAIIAMAAINGAIGVVISTFQGLSAIFGVAKIAIMALSGPIGLTVIALGILVAAGALVYQNWDLIKQKATEIWGAITSYIGNKISEIKDYFSTNFPAMTAIVSGSIEIIKTLFIGGFNLIKNTVTTVLGVIKAVISGDFKAIPGIIGNGLKTAVSVVSGMMTNILNVIKEAGKKLFNIGRDFIQGFINGIKSVGSGVVSAASSMVGNAIAAVKKRQDSASPSKVTTKLGGDFAKGMENGIKKGAKAVKTEAQKMAEQAVAAVKTGVENLKREIALFGNESLVAALDYDIKIGKYRGANTSELRSLTQQKEQLELSKKLTDANKAMQDSIDGLTKQLALFGNKNGLAEFDFDVSAGKYAGVSQSNINKTRELLRALDIRNEEADVTKEMVSLQRSIYDASVLYSTELGRMNYELDDIHGKYKNINEEIKDSLRNEAAKLDAVKLQATAVKSMMDIDRQLSLLGDGSLFNQLAYEMSEASGSLYNLDEGLKEAWLSKAALLDQARQELAINESIDKSLDSINKEIALMATSGSALDEFIYDLNNTDKYAKASGDSINALGDALTKLDQLKKGDALMGVMGELQEETPLGKIQADYDRRLGVIEEYEKTHTDMLENAKIARLAIEQSYMDAKQQLMLSQSEAIFSGLAGISKGFLGEQSGVYRALYAIQKGYALSSALLSSKKAIMDAWSNTAGGFWSKAAAAGKVALSTSAITSAIAGLSPKGFKQGGYTGNMGASQVAGVVHGQEYVFDAQSTKRIGVDNLNAMRSGKAPQGGDNINVNVTVNSDGSSNVESNKQMGRSMGNALIATIQQQIIKEKRQGGLLYG